jgi:hypothetical protein
LMMEAFELRCRKTDDFSCMDSSSSCDVDAMLVAAKS